jgi:hypothetical protein
MFERQITEEDVRNVLNNGIIIEDYPDDRPYPSKLSLGWCGIRQWLLIMKMTTKT